MHPYQNKTQFVTPGPAMRSGVAMSKEEDVSGRGRRGVANRAVVNSVASPLAVLTSTAVSDEPCPSSPSRASSDEDQEMSECSTPSRTEKRLVRRDRMIVSCESEPSRRLERASPSPQRKEIAVSRLIEQRRAIEDRLKMKQEELERSRQQNDVVVASAHRMAEGLRVCEADLLEMACTAQQVAETARHVAAEKEAVEVQNTALMVSIEELRQDLAKALDEAKREKEDARKLKENALLDAERARRSTVEKELLEAQNQLLTLGITRLKQDVALAQDEAKREKESSETQNRMFVQLDGEMRTTKQLLAQAQTDLSHSRDERGRTARHLQEVLDGKLEHIDHLEEQLAVSRLKLDVRRRERQHAFDTLAATAERLQEEGNQIAADMQAMHLRNVDKMQAALRQQHAGAQCKLAAEKQARMQQESQLLSLREMLAVFREEREVSFQRIISLEQQNVLLQKEAERALQVEAKLKDANEEVADLHEALKELEVTADDLARSKQDMRQEFELTTRTVQDQLAACRDEVAQLTETRTQHEDLIAQLARELDATKQQLSSVTCSLQAELAASQNEIAHEAVAWEDEHEAVAWVDKCAALHGAMSEEVRTVQRECTAKQHEMADLQEAMETLESKEHERARAEREMSTACTINDRESSEGLKAVTDLYCEAFDEALCHAGDGKNEHERAHIPIQHHRFVMQEARSQIRLLEQENGLLQRECSSLQERVQFVSNRAKQDMRELELQLLRELSIAELTQDMHTEMQAEDEECSVPDSVDQFRDTTENKTQKSESNTRSGVGAAPHLPLPRQTSVSAMVGGLWQRISAPQSDRSQTRLFLRGRGISLRNSDAPLLPCTVQDLDGRMLYGFVLRDYASLERARTPTGVGDITPEDRKTWTWGKICRLASHLMMWLVCLLLFAWVCGSVMGAGGRIAAITGATMSQLRPDEPAHLGATPSMRVKNIHQIGLNFSHGVPSIDAPDSLRHLTAMENLMLPVAGAWISWRRGQALRGATPNATIVRQGPLAVLARMTPAVPAMLRATDQLVCGPRERSAGMEECQPGVDGHSDLAGSMPRQDKIVLPRDQRWGMLLWP